MRENVVARSRIILVLGVICLGLFLILRLPEFLTSEKGFMSVVGLLVAAFSLAEYDKVMLPMLLIVFFWAGMDLPYQQAAFAARWIVLAMAAVFGLIGWPRRSRRLEFGAVHLLALFTVFTILFSALGASNRRVALLKCLSLFLMFLYLSIGSRVVLQGREASMIRKLLVISQVAVIVCGILYVADLRYWSNPNALGAILGMIAFPVVLWGWLIARDHAERRFAAFALMICATLLLLSRARAGMLAAGISGFVILYSMRRIRTLAGAALVLGLFFLAFFLATPERFQDYARSVIYKPSETNPELSLLNSRLVPWQTTIKTIRENPWFGTGLGTPDKTVEGTFTTGSYREHGNSYLTILEGLGLFGVLPFALLLVVLLHRVWTTCLWMRRMGNPAHSAVPLVGVIIAGLVHAGFEDWLLSAGSYLCVVFWVIAFWTLDLTGTNALSKGPAWLRNGFRSQSPGRVQSAWEK